MDLEINKVKETMGENKVFTQQKIQIFVNLRNRVKIFKER